MHTNTKTKFALGLSLIFLASALVLYWLRDGYLSWIGIFLGTALVLKILGQPSSSDFAVAGAVLTGWLLCWGIAIYFVYSGWESGEVIEISFTEDGVVREVRTWVVDWNDHPVLLYDSTSSAAGAIASSATVTISRNGLIREFVSRQIASDENNGESWEEIFSLFDEKYGHLSGSTDTFYNWLGSRKNRSVSLFEFTEI